MRRINIYKKIAFILSLILILVSAQSSWSAENYKWQERPIELGTSGGNIEDINKWYCCNGTLGALVQDLNNNQYILSNNHILANTNQGEPGDIIIQPGLADQTPACDEDSGDEVANLSEFVPISFRKRILNTVDAATAKIKSGKVDTSGKILGIGEVSNKYIATPLLNMPVMKSGRTTGLRHGKITSINATVKVTYNRTCGKGSRKAIFTNQIIISPGSFSTPGDSGSLIVEDCSPSPRAVGLLFAGNFFITVANPISEVLTLLDVSLVGTEDYCTSAETLIKPSNFSITPQSKMPPQINQGKLKAVSMIKERHEKAILNIDGVVGVGVGLSNSELSEVVIEVYVKKPANKMRRFIPEKIEDVSVKIVKTGEIFAI